MTRWMIQAAVLGALAGPTYGQTFPPPPAAEEPTTARPATPAPPARVAPRGAPGVVPVPPLPPAAGNMVFEARPAKREKVTYLGAVTSSAPAAMREQLKLAPGVGLVVDAVEPDTAAEKAGLKQHDVLERLDDQMLVNPEQLATLLRSKKPADEVTLAIVRQGERQKLKAKLEEKEVNAGTLQLLGGGGFGGGFGGGGIAAGGFQPGGRMIYTTANPYQAPAPRAGAAQNWGAVDAFGIGPGGNRVMVRTLGDGKQTTVWADDEVSISVERAGGKATSVVVTDKKTDKVLYTGNADGLDKVLDARPELKEKVKKALDAADRDPVRLQLAAPVAVGRGAAGGKVVRWQDDDHVLIMRMAGRAPAYLLALSKKDGRTLFDGPVTTEEDRRSVPAEIAEQFQMICGQPDLARELGATDKPTAVEPKPAPEPKPR